MASQTRAYGTLGKPELGGNKTPLIMGTAKFVSSATVCTITVPFKNQVAGVVLDWKTRPAAGCRNLYTTGTIKANAVYVSRATGSASGMTFWYKIYGW